MRTTKYISIFALAMVFAASSCTKMDKLTECKEGKDTSEEVSQPESTAFITHGNDHSDTSGITDPDNDEDHDRDDEKVVVDN